MITLRKLIQNPGSPDIALKQKWHDSEAALARLAHVNRLSRDVYDIKFYELDLDGAASGTLLIDSKKGIVEILNADATSTSLNISLQNSEIIPNHDKFYVQFSVYCDTSDVTPLIIGRGYVGDLLNLEIKNLETAADWSLLYFYYELVKID